MKLYNYVIILLIGLFVSSCNDVDENNLSNNINNVKKDSQYNLLLITYFSFFSF